MAFGGLAKAATLKHARPRIGVTGPNRGGLAAWFFTALAVRRAGGRPVRIQPKRMRTIDDLDGLIVGGGADVSPGLYGQTHRSRLSSLHDRGAHGWRRLAGWLLFPLMFTVRRLLTTKAGGTDHQRDRLEKSLLSAAFERNLPVLGICRGMQLINVVAGGSLHQDLEGFYDEYPAIRSVLPRKRVALRSGTRLEAIMGRPSSWVNALHSQAVDDLGAGLRVAASEANGIIQAIESTGDGLVIGVQWHPEYLPQRRQQQALFRALVRAACCERS